MYHFDEFKTVQQMKLELKTPVQMFIDLAFKISFAETSCWPYRIVVAAAAQPQHMSHTLTQIRSNQTFPIVIQNQLIFHSKQKTCDSIVIAASKRMELYAA